eukprot:1159879-Pelagomonas_calceolata.AAC.2
MIELNEVMKTRVRRRLWAKKRAAGGANLKRNRRKEWSCHGRLQGSALSLVMPGAGACSSYAREIQSGTRSTCSA